MNSKPYAIKATAPFTLEGRGVVYGGVDLTGDRFSADTDFGSTRSFLGMPVYYDHAMSGIKSQIGTVKAWTPMDDGIDVQIELDRRHAYAADVMKLAESGALGLSTGALPHLVERVDGEIKRWVVGEISLTPTPAEPRTTAGITTKGTARTAAGIGLTNTSAAITTEDTMSDIKDAVKAAISELAGEPVQGGTIYAGTKTAPGQKVHTDRGFSNEPVSAVKAWLGKGDEGGVKATLVAGSVTGSYLINQYNMPMIFEKRVAASLLGEFPAIFKQSITGYNYQPRIEDALGSFASRTEIQSANFSEDTYARPDVALTRYNRSMRFSNSFLRDSSDASFETQLASSVGRTYGLIINDIIVAAIIARAGTSETLATTTTLDAGDIDNMFYKLPDGYDVNDECGWIMRRLTLQQAKALTSNPRIFDRDYSFAGKELLGAKVATNSSIAAMAASATSILFGNFNFVNFVENDSMEISRNASRYEDTYETAIFVNSWMASYLTVADAFVKGVNPAT
jgi:HK97 family phage major capsid protein